jgi:Golgi phosphoprotein 3 (GPP34)
VLSDGRREPSLKGTGLVADDLYLLAHHDATGRPLLQPRPLCLGLAAGLLAELILDGGIGLRQDGMVRAERGAPADQLSRQVREKIITERAARPVRDWVLYLARGAAEDVARRLERSGYLIPAGGRVPWRPRRWVPVDADWAFAPLVRVRSSLDPARPAGPHDAVLAALALACGLEFRVDQYVPPPRRDPADLTRQLGSSLRGLIAETQAVVDSALLSHRT